MSSGSKVSLDRESTELQFAYAGRKQEKFKAQFELILAAVVLDNNDNNKKTSSSRSTATAGEQENLG